MEASWEYVVVLHFWTFQDCSGKEVAQRFLDTMYRFGLVPDKFGDEDPPRHNFKPSSTGSFLKLWRRRPGQLNMLKLGRMGFQALLSLSRPMPGLITFAIHDEYFQGTENTAKFLEFSDELYEMFKPVSGEISHKKEWDSKTVVIEPIKVGDKTVNAEAHIAVRPTKGLPGIFWVNYFGPTFVDFYTRAKLEAAPCYNKKRFADGGYRVLTGPSPLDYAKPETKKMEQDLIEHLGPDTFFDVRPAEQGGWYILHCCNRRSLLGPYLPRTQWLRWRHFVEAQVSGPISPASSVSKPKIPTLRHDFLWSVMS